MIKKIKKKIPILIKNRTLHNFFYLSSSNLVLKIFYIIVGFYIPYFLGATNYGYYSIACAYVNFFAIFTLSGMNKVIFREGVKSKSVLARHINQCIPFYFLESIVLILLIIVSCFFFNKYPYQLKIMITIFSINIIYNIFKGLFNSVILSYEKMYYLSILPIIEKTLFYTFAIIFLKLGYNWKTIVILTLVSNMLSFGMLFCITRKLTPLKFKWRIHIKEKILKQAFIFSAISIGVVLTTKIDVLMLSILGTPTETGIYSFAEKIVLQFQAFNGIIAMVTFPLFIRKINKSNRTKNSQYLRYILLMLLFLIITFFILGKIVSFAIITFMGQQFSESTKVLEVLFVYLGFSFAIIPLTNIMQAAYLEKVVLGYIPISIPLNIGLNYFLYHQIGIIGFAFSTVIVVSFLFVYYCIIASYYFNKTEKVLT